MTNSNPEIKPSSRWGRAGLALLVLAVWMGTGGWAYFDIETRSEQSRVSTIERLEGVARVANLLFLAEESRVDGQLERLRTELRAQDVWANPSKVEPERGREEIDRRRLDGLMRRGLSDADSLSTLELIVAGHDGLFAHGFEREGQAIRMTERAPAERVGIAKALWYADEVQRGVASSGRRVERGEVSFEAEGVGDDAEVDAATERPLLRAAIGLHEPGELVQGVLVASIDLTRVARQLSGLANTAERVTLSSADGRPLDPSRATESEGSRWVDLTGRVLGSEFPPDAFVADGRIVLGRLLSHVDGSVTDLVVLIEADAPSIGVAAWLETAWPFALAGLSLVSPLAIGLLLRKRDAGGLVGAQSNSTVTDRARNHDGVGVGADPIIVSPEAFALRAWLSDIRGCLEREAATRGLSLDLRCERSLPEAATSDPAWLGGLLVAMGREALDATSGERVVFEVIEDEGDTLRFEVDAGGVELCPVRGMREVAASVGGRLESAREGRLALVVPAILN